jgi:putative membrane protein
VPWIQAFIWAFKPANIVDIRRSPREEAKAIDEQIARLTGQTGTASRKQRKEGNRPRRATKRTKKIRTTLTMATFGFGTVGFFRSLREKFPTPLAVHLHESAIRFGIPLIILDIIATVLAGISHWLTLRRLRRNDAVILTQWPLSIPVAMLLVVIGLVSLWNLHSL